MPNSAPRHEKSQTNSPEATACIEIEFCKFSCQYFGVWDFDFVSLCPLPKHPLVPVTDASDAVVAYTFRTLSRYKIHRAMVDTQTHLT